MEFSIPHLSKEYCVPSLVFLLSINNITTEHLFKSRNPWFLPFLFHLTHHQVLSIILINQISNSSTSFYLSSYSSLLAFTLSPSKIFHTTRVLYKQIRWHFPLKALKTLPTRLYTILPWQTYPTSFHLTLSLIPVTVTLVSFNIFLLLCPGLFIHYYSCSSDWLLLPQPLSSGSFSFFRSQLKSLFRETFSGLS